MPSWICNMCDKLEDNCTCDKYCMVCKSMEDARLCYDGCYYCAICRESLDLVVEN